MIIDIQGSQYTSAREDLDLEKLREVLRQTLQGILSPESWGEGLEVDASPLVELLRFVYTLGWVCSNDSKPRELRPAEKERLQRASLEFMGCVRDQVRHSHVSDRKLYLELHEANERMRQIYYMGREDGAR